MTQAVHGMSLNLLLGHSRYLERERHNPKKAVQNLKLPTAHPESFICAQESPVEE